MTGAIGADGLPPQLGVHIFGASGSGTSTLGARLAKHLDNCVVLDTDAFYWLPTDPPFVEKRDPADRVLAIRRATTGVARWVLSGSLVGWGDSLVNTFTHAVFVSLDNGERLARLEARERERYGMRIDPGGDMFTQSVEFMAWAGAYETAGPEQRSRALHEAWLDNLGCPVLRLTSNAPPDILAGHVLDWLRG